MDLIFACRKPSVSPYHRITAPLFTPSSLNQPAGLEQLSVTRRKSKQHLLRCTFYTGVEGEKRREKKINVITHVHSEVRTTTNFTNPDSQLGLEPREVAPSESNYSRLSPVRTRIHITSTVTSAGREKKEKEKRQRKRLGGESDAL